MASINPMEGWEEVTTAGSMPKRERKLRDALESPQRLDVKPRHSDERIDSFTNAKDAEQVAASWRAAITTYKLTGITVSVKSKAGVFAVFAHATKA